MHNPSHTNTVNKKTRPGKKSGRPNTSSRHPRQEKKLDTLGTLQFNALQQGRKESNALHTFIGRVSGKVDVVGNIDIAGNIEEEWKVLEKEEVEVAETKSFDLRASVTSMVNNAFDNFSSLLKTTSANVVKTIGAAEKKTVDAAEKKTVDAVEEKKRAVTKEFLERENLKALRGLLHHKDASFWALGYDMEGSTPLGLALQQDLSVAFLRLLTQKEEWIICDDNQNNFLHYIALGSLKRPELVKFAEELLLYEKFSKHPIVDVSNKVGETALHFAVKAKNLVFIKFLLEEGASHLEDSKRIYPLDIAVSEGSIDLIKALLKHSKIDISLVNSARDAEKNTYLHTVARQNNATLLSWFSGRYKEKLNLSPVNVYGETPFYVAVKSGAIDVVNKMLQLAGEQKTELLKQCDLEGGNTPLHAAVSCGHTEIVKILLENSSDTNDFLVENKQGQTSYKLASSFVGPQQVALMKVLSELRKEVITALNQKETEDNTNKKTIVELMGDEIALYVAHQNFSDVLKQFAQEAKTEKNDLLSQYYVEKAKEIDTFFSYVGVSRAIYNGNASLYEVPDAATLQSDENEIMRNVSDAQSQMDKAKSEYVNAEVEFQLRHKLLTDSSQYTKDSNKPPLDKVEIGVLQKVFGSHGAAIYVKVANLQQLQQLDKDLEKEFKKKENEKLYWECALSFFKKVILCIPHVRKLSDEIKQLGHYREYLPELRKQAYEGAQYKKIKVDESMGIIYLASDSTRSNNNVQADFKTLHQNHTPLTGQQPEISQSVTTTANTNAANNANTASTKEVVDAMGQFGLHKSTTSNEANTNRHVNPSITPPVAQNTDQRITNQR